MQLPKMKLGGVLAVLCSCTLASPVVKDDPAPPQYRLPTNASPTTYTISLYVDKLAFHLKKFEGQVDISFAITAKTNSIKLHAGKIDLTSVALSKKNGDAANQIPITDLSLDEVTEIVTVNVENELEPSMDYLLSFKYVGTLADDDMYGFYQSTYKDADGNDKYLATTQFESTSARRAFPCFDEPRFKAKFDITIKYPKNFHVIANTKAKATTEDGDYKTTTFETTPKMSTYLVAFIMSEFTEVSNGDVEKPVSVWGKPGTEDNRKVALDQAPKLLEEMGKFTGIDFFKTHGLQKMDVAAIPDFAAGAMENWGLVTYREVALLDNGDDSSNSDIQRITTFIAHEFSHQWFGDLVTMDWWSDTWLNEGFATYFEYHIAHKVNEGYDLLKRFVISVHQSIMLDDANPSVLPVSSKVEDVNTPTEVNNKFSLISYDKGGSVIRMMEHFLGGKYQDGLKKYLNDNMNRNTVPGNLWDAFDAQSPTTLPSGKKMADVMDSWINKPGFPYVTVSYKDGKILISQKRFLISEGDETTKWYIPISYTKKGDSNPFVDTTPKDWVTPDGDLSLDVELQNDDWIILNNQVSGYYRVNYETGLLKRITAALMQDNFADAILDINRAQLIDDVFNLARIGQADYSQAFELSNYLKNETNYYPWASAFNSYSFLIARTGTSKLGQAISTKLKGLLESLYKSAPIDVPKPDDTLYTLNQVQASTWACKLAHEECVTKALDQFHTYKSGGAKPNPNIRAVVYCTALRNSAEADAQSDWDFLWDKFLHSASSAEQNVLLSSLGCTKNEAILKEYLKKSINADSGIRKQDAVTAFKAVYNGNPSNVDIAYSFLKENNVTIANYYKGLDGISSLVMGLAEKFTTQKQVDDLKAFVTNEDLSEEFKIVSRQAVDVATANIKWVSSFEKQLDEYFKIKANDGGGAGSVQVGTAIMLSLALTIYHVNLF